VPHKGWGSTLQRMGSRLAGRCSKGDVCAWVARLTAHGFAPKDL
jgi:hypothetical protein